MQHRLLQAVNQGGDGRQLTVVGHNWVCEGLGGKLTRPLLVNSLHRGEDKGGGRRQKEDEEQEKEGKEEKEELKGN